MTYYDSYKSAVNETELIDLVKRDARIALAWGDNAKRLDEIMNAANKVLEERGLSPIKKITYNKVSRSIWKK